MSTRVLIIGGSEQGRQVIDVLEAAGDHEVVGVLDGELARGSDVVGYPVLGRDDELAECAKASGAESVLVAVGDNFTRGRLLARALAARPDLEAVRAVHPGATIARNAVVGPGSIVMAGAVVSNGCVLGTGTLLGTNASVDHDCTVGDFASLGPGATTGGSVRLGEYTAVGLGANVIHGIELGAHTVIGAGALVIDDVSDHVVAFGVPARVVRKREEGESYLGRA